MKKFNLTISQQAYLLIYKLLHDALALMLGTFALMLVAEAILPGIVTTHISMAKVIIAIVLAMGGIVWIGEKFEITYELPVLRKNKHLPPLILFTFLLLGNSLLKFPLWANLTITLTTLFIFFLIYKLIFSEQHHQ